MKNEIQQIQPLYKHKIRGSFWHFVQSFWQPHGGMDICDEWVASGGWYADLYPNRKYQTFKVSFHYHLELSRHYHLSVQLVFSSYQKEMIDCKIRVSSKLEAIRWALKVIKQFENSPIRLKEIWLKLRRKTPIVKIVPDEGAIWIASCIVGEGSNSIYDPSLWGGCHESDHPMGTGKFYYLAKLGQWCWHTLDVTWYGYSGCGSKQIPFDVWLSIKGHDPSLDLIIDEAINLKYNSKFTMIDNQQTGLDRAQQFLDDFYKEQSQEKPIQRYIPQKSLQLA